MRLQLLLLGILHSLLILNLPLMHAKCSLVRYEGLTFQIKEDPQKTVCKSGVILQDSRSFTSFCFVPDPRGGEVTCTGDQKADGSSLGPFSSLAPPTGPTLFPGPPNQKACPSAPLPRDTAMETKGCDDPSTRQVLAQPEFKLCKARCNLDPLNPVPQLVEYKCMCASGTCGWISLSAGGIITQGSPIAKCGILPLPADTLFTSSPSPLSSSLRPGPSEDNSSVSDAPLPPPPGPRGFEEEQPEQPEQPEPPVRPQLPVPPEQPVPPDSAFDAAGPPGAEGSAAAEPPAANNRRLPGEARKFNAVTLNRRFKDAQSESGDSGALPPAVGGKAAVADGESAGNKSSNATAGTANGTDAAGGDGKGKDTAAGDGKGKDTAAADGKGKDTAAGEGKGKDATASDGKGKDAAAGKGKDAAVGEGKGKDAAAGEGKGKDAAAGEGKGKDAAAGEGKGKDAAAGEGKGKDAAAGEGKGKEAGEGKGKGGKGGSEAGVAADGADGEKSSGGEGGKEAATAR